MTTTRTRMIAAAAAAALLTSGGVAAAYRGSPGPPAGGGPGGTACATSAATASTAALSAAERATLIRMRQEEKLARDVYLTLAERSSLSVFDRIAVSEQRHMDRVAALLRRYGVPDPVAGMGRGEFADPAFDALYARLVSAGSGGDAAAAAVGVRIERMDIGDLNGAIRAAGRPDIKRVLENLRTASRHHLAAFTALT